MDLSPEQAEQLVRHAMRNPGSTTVGPRVWSALLTALENQRELNRILMSAFADQAQTLYTVQEELAELRCPGGQGGETGSEPPPPRHPARLLGLEPGELVLRGTHGDPNELADEPGELPRRLPTTGELFWGQQRARYVSVNQRHPEHDDTHAPMIDDGGHCEACAILLSLRGAG